MKKEFLKFQQLSVLFISHVKELMREPEVLFWGIVFPLLMALGLGIAFTQKADTERNIAVVLMDSSAVNGESAISDFLKNKTEKVKPEEEEPDKYKLMIKDEKLGNTEYTFLITNWEKAIILLKRGEISLIIKETDNGFEYHFDPVSPEGQLTYLKLSRVIENKESADNKSNIEPMTISGSRYIDFLIPGLLSMGIMMSSVWGLSYNIITKRSKKLLRRMIATPMKKSHFLISLMIVRITMNLVESLLLFFFAYLVFGVTIQGSLTALFLVFIAGNIAFAGLATLISSRTSNTEVGNGLINAVSTPMIVLSGVFFSYHNFPDVIIPFLKVLPLTLLADAVRSIFIEGAGYQEVAIPFLVLSSMGIILFAVGLKIFKWY